MNTLTKLFLNAGLPVQFGSQSYETKMSKLIAAEMYWRAEMRVLRKHWVRGGWAMLPSDSITSIDVDADVPQ